MPTALRFRKQFCQAQRSEPVAPAGLVDHAIGSPTAIELESGLEQSLPTIVQRCSHEECRRHQPPRRFLATFLSFTPAPSFLLGSTGAQLSATSLMVTPGMLELWKLLADELIQLSLDPFELILREAQSLTTRHTIRRNQDVDMRARGIEMPASIGQRIRRS